MSGADQQVRLEQFAPTTRLISVCEIPGCGRQTAVWRYSDAQIWLDRDDFGTPRFVHVCPEHKAAWTRLVSRFLTSRAVVTLLDHDGNTETVLAAFANPDDPGIPQ